MLFILCFNIAAYILSKLNIEPAVGLVPGLNVEGMQSVLNASRIVGGFTSTSPGSNLAYVLLSGVFLVVQGLAYLFEFIVIALAAFPLMLNSFGVPLPIVIGLGALWSYIFAMWIIQFATGRETE